MPFNGKRSNYRRGKKSSTKKRTTRRVSPTIKSYVNKAINRNVENKIEETLSANNTIASYSVNPSLFCISCIPYAGINQGLGQGDRIGNTIRTKYCRFSYVLRPSVYDAVVNPTVKPLEVLVFFGVVKNSKPLQPVSSDFAKLFQAGDSTHAPYSNLLDTIAEINKDWFQVYKSFRHKIGYSGAYSPSAQAVNASTQQYYLNNDFKYNIIKKVNLTKHCPKTLKFNDATQQPTNGGLWMWAMCVNADGTTSTSTTPCFMDYKVTYHYEDA